MANLNLIKDDVVKVTLRGVEIGLIFTLNAYALLEEKYGSMDAAFAQFEKERMTDVIFFIWAGAQDEQPELTLRDMGRLLTAPNMQLAMDAATRAIKGSQAADTEAEVEEAVSPN